MRIRAVRVVPRRGAVSGVRSGTAEPAHRDGLLLRVEMSDGVVGRGEASPLAGYSPDSLAAARDALTVFDWGSLPEPDPAGDKSAATLHALAPKISDLPPSARFAVETAFLDVMGQRAQLPIWALLSAQISDVEVPLCSFLGGLEDSGVVRAAAAEAGRGAHTVKLKIDGAHFGEREEERLLRIREAVGPTRLRLDANRSLSLGTDALGRLARVAPELVEEPVSTESLFLLETPPVFIALDESLQDPSFFARVAPELSRLRCVAVVLKPMALGGVSVCLALARAARAHGLDVTVSHLFDGPVALAACAHLALAVGSRTRASGLALHAGLAAWPKTDIPSIGATTLLAGNAPGLGLPEMDGLS